MEASFGDLMLLASASKLKWTRAVVLSQDDSSKGDFRVLVGNVD